MKSPFLEGFSFFARNYEIFPCFYGEIRFGVVGIVKKWMSVLLALLLFFSGTGALAVEDRASLRAAYRAIGGFDGDTPYDVSPQITAPYAAGSLSEAALEDALNYLNFLRRIAGLAPVRLSPIYDARCQHGAVLLAALDYADHNAPQPADMDGDFYTSAHLATASSNIARFNWMRPTILREGVAYFVRDDGDANLSVLGHRRWALNPVMAETGFGLANSETGMSYVVMYAHDLGSADAAWSEVCWPAGGAFPVELMHADLAWSVSLNPAIYDVAHSQIQAELTEETLGLSFRFNCTDETGDGFCTVNSDGYGSGPCVIFRPDFSGADFTDYLQNQRWMVRVTGLRRWTGEDAELEYQVEMCSLYAQEAASVEMSLLEAELKPGETLALTAAVVPSYADDLTVTWSSTDPSVAEVNEDGVVTARAAGACKIVAATVNGRSDRCALTVAE